MCVCVRERVHACVCACECVCILAMHPVSTQVVMASFWFVSELRQCTTHKQQPEQAQSGGHGLLLRDLYHHVHHLLHYLFVTLAVPVGVCCINSHIKVMFKRNSK